MKTAWSLALLVLCAETSAAVAETAAARAEVPITQTRLSDGTIRYSIPVQLGSQAIDAMLDTGSTGLRVLAAGLDAANYQEGDDAPAYPYGSGVVLHGEIAHARIAIGGLAPDATENFQLVKSVDCETRVPNCPASRISAADYRIGGDGLARQGFYAIIGVSVPLSQSRTRIPNPLVAIADAWIIVLPRPGDSAPGKLVLNPDPAERSGFTMFPLPHLDIGAGDSISDIGGFGNAVPGCLVREETNRAFCGGVLFDSGAIGVIAMTQEVKGTLIWPEGAHGTFAFGDSSGVKLAASFSVGTNPATAVRLVPPQRGEPLMVQAGALPFYVFSVLYDRDAQQVGLMAR